MALGSEAATKSQENIVREQLQQIPLGGLQISPPKGIGTKTVELPSGHWIPPVSIPIDGGPLVLAFELSQQVAFVFLGSPPLYMGYVWGRAGLAVESCGGRKAFIPFELGAAAGQIMQQLEQGKPAALIEGVNHLLSGVCGGVPAP